MKQSTQSLAVLGLSALSLAALAPAGQAVAPTPPPIGQYNFVYSLPRFNFTPSSSIAPGTDDVLIFTFGAQSLSGSLGGTPVYDANFTSSNAAVVSASNFNYTGNWQIDSNALLTGYETGNDYGHYGYASSNNELTQANLYNNGTATSLGFDASFNPVLTSPDDGKKTGTPTTSSIYIPFSSVGTSASFDIGYFDDPTLSDFTLQEQYTNAAGQTVTKNLIAGTFSGTAFTPAGTGGGTPGTPAVPEPSSLALMGLGALPLLCVVRARRRAARA